MAASSEAHEAKIGLYVCVGLYMATLMATAVVAWRRKRRAAMKQEAVSAQYGGSFTAPLLILTTFSTTFSGYTVTGVPAEASLKGFFAVRWIPAVTMVSVGAILFYPRLRRLSKVRGYSSPNDFLTDRYRSVTLRVLGSLGTCLPQYFYLTVQLTSFGSTLEGLTLGAVPNLAGMIIFAVIVMAMEKVGGMNSVVLSDALQAVLMIGGFIILLVTITARYGTLSDIQPADCQSLGFVNQTSLDHLVQLGDLAARPARCPAASAGSEECAAYGCIAAAKPDFYAYPSREEQSAFFFFVLNFAAFPLNPHVVQRVYIASTDGALRLVCIVLAFASFLAMPPGIVAGVMDATFGPSWAQSSQDATAFVAIGNELMTKGAFEYVLVAVLFCAALAAIMSTADSVLLGVANALSIDVFKRTVRPDATPNQVVMCGFLVSLCYMAGGIVGGVFIAPAMFGTLLTVQNGVLLQILPAFVLGLFFEVSARAVTGGILAGVAVFFACMAKNPLAPHVPAADVGAAANLLALGLLQLLAPGREREEESARSLFGDRLTASEIRAVMRGVREPRKSLLALAFACLVLSTPVFGKPGNLEPAIAGFPRWAFVSVVLQIAGATFSALAAFLWRPQGDAKGEDRALHAAEECCAGDAACGAAGANGKVFAELPEAGHGDGRGIEEDVKAGLEDLEAVDVKGALWDFEQEVKGRGAAGEDADAAAEEEGPDQGKEEPGAASAEEEAPEGLARAGSGSSRPKRRAGRGSDMSLHGLLCCVFVQGMVAD